MRDTATANKTAGRQKARLLAIFSVCLGLLAFAWGVSVLPELLRALPLHRVSVRIIQGYTFSTGDLDALRPELDRIERQSASCHIALRSTAVIRLAIAERSIADANRDRIDNDKEALRTAVRAALACTPTDAYLWLVLFWIENDQNGFQERNLEFLKLSYDYGPNEGWIALKRNPLALGIYAQLPPALQQLSLNEFAGLLRSGFISQTVDTLIGPAWPIHDKLLASIANQPERQRYLMANDLYRRGYDVIVPGIKAREARPWR